MSDVILKFKLFFYFSVEFFFHVNSRNINSINGMIKRKIRVWLLSRIYSSTIELCDSSRVSRAFVNRRHVTHVARIYARPGGLLQKFALNHEMDSDWKRQTHSLSRFWPLRSLVSDTRPRFEVQNESSLPRSRLLTKMDRPYQHLETSHRIANS